jgi:hypothetical protein
VCGIHSVLEGGRRHPACLLAALALTLSLRGFPDAGHLVSASGFSTWSSASFTDPGIQKDCTAQASMQCQAWGSHSLWLLPVLDDQVPPTLSVFALSSCSLMAITLDTV